MEINLVKSSFKEDLINDYNQDSLQKGLIQMVPMGSFIDSYLTSSYNQILKNRTKTFLDELVNGDIELSAELIESEDFLHTYFSTFKAALFTKQREKIRLFSKLLINGITTSLINKSDEYDDYLKILEELTSREITILFILNNFEDKNPITEGVNPLQRAGVFWVEFEKEIFNQIDISPSELNGLLTRIQRTGCYQEITGSYWGYTGGQGYLTETYHKLKRLISLKQEDLVYYRKL